MQWARSVLFVGWMYGLMLAMGLVCLPLAIWSPEGAWWSLRRYSGIVLWSLRAICGLRAETRGPIPDDDVLIAAKHQSFLDILILVNRLHRPKFVMKRSLRWAPVLGFYAMRIGCAPVDRAARGRAVKRMVADIGGGDVRGGGGGGAMTGQTVIYPQGTRVAPGVAAPYRIGVAALYEAYGLPVVPVATNGGVFWARTGVMRRPGLAVVEFLPRIPPGLPRREIMARIEREVEEASARLLDEAGRT